MLVDLTLPPGMRTAGTPRGSRGAWRDGSLVRWNPDLRPVGGWTPRSAATVPGATRAMLAWRDNNGSKWIALGSSQGLFVMTASGVLHDITPEGFRAGRADASTGAGYGSGLYGADAYGTARDDAATVNPASVWTLDLWNDRLVGCLAGDGRLYQWDLDVGAVAEAIPGAPEGCDALVVTENNMLMALRGRTALWSQQGEDTDWQASELNQAGDLAVKSAGLFLCARQVRGATLLFSTADLWAAVYQGPPTVYGFQQAGLDCGPVAVGSPVVIDTGRCVWMGAEGFFLYDGFVQPLPCDVRDRVFGDLNLTQVSKTSGWHNARFGEVWWHYPSAGSAENDRYVLWNYQQGYWSLGALARTAGHAAAGVFDAPVAAAATGQVFAQESGADWGGARPFARSGPFEFPAELASGERRVLLAGLIPDEATLGDCRFRLHGREWPNLPETTFGPYVITGAPVDLMAQTRSVELSVEFLADGCWGTPRLDARPVSRR